jgi:thiosulfate/3-mercaptopyruvate sulfurtransferase
MKKKLIVISLMLLLSTSMLVTRLLAQDIPAIVSTGWLEENMDIPNMVILDVRETESYEAGHIPGSINVPAFPNWYINNPGEQPPWMELPEEEKLFATIGEAGITTKSVVVIIARTSDSKTGELGAYGLTKASRAAITLIYAGINKVIFLNGGYDKWNAEGKTVSTKPAIPQATTYDGKVNKSMFITKEYVENKLGRSIIIDTRDCDTYFGLGTDYSSKRAGHIPTAKVLPAPWFWQTTKAENGEKSYLMWKDTEEINEIALTVLGENMEEEIIDYCGVGGYASPVWFLLTQVVGYKNVKFYDGSMQEWTSDPEAPVTKYKYE